jgi:hypothetical protein
MLKFSGCSCLISGAEIEEKYLIIYIHAILIN